jgi:hypothetical protein
MTPPDAAPGADHRVNLIDEEDGARLLLELRDDALQAFLEVAAIFRTGDERPMSRA